MPAIYFDSAKFFINKISDIETAIAVIYNYSNLKPYETSENGAVYAPGV